MQNQEPMTHHQTNRRCVGFERGDELTYNWEWVDCEDCWEAREKRKKGAVYMALVFAGVAFLLFVSCLAIGI